MEKLGKRSSAHEDEEGNTLMDPIAIILAALKAGSMFVGEKIAGEAVKDSYTTLKKLLSSRLKSDEEKQALIQNPDLALDAWQVGATQILERMDAQNDLAIINTAQKLLTQVNQSQTSTGKFNLQANTVGTVIQGDHSTIILPGTDRKTGKD
jgi:hypothetical protein